MLSRDTTKGVIYTPEPILLIVSTTCHEDKSVDSVPFIYIYLYPLPLGEGEAERGRLFGLNSDTLT